MQSRVGRKGKRKKQNIGEIEKTKSAEQKVPILEHQQLSAVAQEQEGKNVEEKGLIVEQEEKIVEEKGFTLSELNFGVRSPIIIFLDLKYK